MLPSTNLPKWGVYLANNVSDRAADDINLVIVFKNLQRRVEFRFVRKDKVVVAEENILSLDLGYGRMSRDPYAGVLGDIDDLHAGGFVNRAEIWVGLLLISDDNRNIGKIRARAAYESLNAGWPPHGGDADGNNIFNATRHDGAPWHILTSAVRSRRSPSLDS